MEKLLASFVRALFGRTFSGAAARTVSSGFGWQGWVIAIAAALALILAAFAGGAWWQGERCGSNSRAAAAASIADAERRAAEAESRAEAARQRAADIERDAAAGSVAAQQERDAAAAAIAGEVERVLQSSAASDSCRLGVDFGGLWNRAVGARPAPAGE